MLGLAVVLTVLAALIWRPLVGNDDSPSGEVTMSTGVITGVYARYGQLLEEQLERDAPDLRLMLEPSVGSGENIERLVSGEADFAIATADAIATYQADDREGADRLRACARLYDDYLQLVVREDSPVHRTADLAGLRVGVGQDNSGVQLVTRALLAAAGLDMDTGVEPVREAINRMPTLLESHEIDAFFWSGGLPTTAIKQLADRVDIRLVPLGDLLDTLAAQGDQAAYYRAAVMPPDAYPDISGTGTIDTIAVANLLVTTDRMDDAVAEQITESIINGRDRIGQYVHAAQRVDLRTAIYTQPLPLHPGAAAYYRAAKS